MKPELVVSQLDQTLHDVETIKRQLLTGDYTSAKRGLSTVASELTKLESKIPAFSKLRMRLRFSSRHRD